MRKSNSDYINNAHMQHACAMHVCKMHTFCILVFYTFCINAKNIYLVLRIFCTYAHFFVICIYAKCEIIPNNMCKT